MSTTSLQTAGWLRRLAAGQLECCGRRSAGCGAARVDILRVRRRGRRGQVLAARARATLAGRRRPAGQRAVHGRSGPRAGRDRRWRAGHVALYWDVSRGGHVARAPPVPLRLLTASGAPRGPVGQRRWRRRTQALGRRSHA